MAKKRKMLYSKMKKMENSPTMRLDLRSPLYYGEAPGLIPFDYPPPTGDDTRELLFCFELDAEQAAHIDPDKDCFLGELSFAGTSLRDGIKPCEALRQRSLQLAAGLYLFTQQRRALHREECIHLAIEQHKDGMWEQLHLGDRLYIRYLYEDGCPVTQVFRAYRE